jgi:hypothetical protein
MKSYDGMLEVTEKDQWLRLKDARGVQIGCRSLQKGDHFSIGAKLLFPIHVVRVGLPAVSVPSRRVCMDHAVLPPVLMRDNASTPPVEDLNAAPLDGLASMAVSSVAPLQHAPPVLLESDKQNTSSNGEGTRMDSDGVSSAVFDSLRLGLDFSHGRNFSKDVRSKFHTTVHPSDSSGHFSMVVSFGRATFRMEEDLVALALEACLGGFCGEFLVSSLKDRVFSFAVASKEVAFHILKLKQYRCQQFKCFFHLWSRGGPNWRREFSLWQQECQTKWILVSPSKRAMQLGLSAMKNSAPKSIHKPMGFLGPKRKLAFAEEISYSACKGYQKPVSSCSATLNVHVACFTDGSLAKGVSEQEVCDADVTQVSVPDNGVSVTIALRQTDNQQPFAQVEELQDEEFEQMIDDMTFKVWKCGRCLSLTHLQKDCTNDIRCRACYSYGHIKKNCFKVLVQAKAQK